MNDAQAQFRQAVDLQTAGRFREACDIYGMLLARHPELNAVRNNLAVCHLELGEADQALELLADLARKSQAPEALTNWANALRALGRFHEAETLYKQVAESCQLDPRAQSNLALVHQDQGRLDEAVAGFAKAVALAPGDASLRANLGGALLMAGDYARGFPAYEFRLAGSATEAAMKATGLALWDGTSLNGGPLLVWTEQGLGDSLQFLRFLSQLEIPVRLMAQAGLQRLASTLPNILSVHGWQETPPQDCRAQAALLSLPRLLGCKSESDIPPPRLAADPLLVRLWGERLGAASGIRVGLSWQGNPAMKADRWRSADLSDFAPLFDLAGLDWISLQTGDAARAIGHMQAPLLDLGSEIADLADTAAIIGHLDLVIAIDSAVAHLAGALNAPVWIMVRANPDWRWKPGATSSPWYPSAKLWRQEKLGDWSGVVGEMADALLHFK